MTAAAYRFNEGRYAFETFPEEIVVLDLVEGTYYSLGGSIAEAWRPLVAGHSVEAVATALADWHDVPREKVAQELSGMLGTLEKEGILVAAEPAAALNSVALNGAAASFREFVFEKHVDMQDLLTLDPIHDVDPEKGWPYT